MYWPNLTGVERSQKIKECSQYLIELNKESTKARKIPSLSASRCYEDFLDRTTVNRIPLGYTINNPRAIVLPLKQFSKLQLYFGNPKSVVPVLENLLRAIEREQMDVTIIKRNENSCFEKKDEKAISAELFKKAELITSSSNDMVYLWKKLASIVMERKEILVCYCKQNNIDVTKTDIHRETFHYMRENCKPICVIIEEFSEFCAYMDQASAKVFSKLFELVRQYQIYVIGCFYPESRFYENDAIYRSFSNEDIVLLFGGRLNMQSLCKIPAEYAVMDQIGAYDRFLMRYKNKYYPLYMPYKEINDAGEDAIEPDDRNIFKA